MFSDIKAGDRLYLTTRNNAQYVEVDRKGRTWFYLKHGWHSRSRFSIATGRMDSNYSEHAQCWKTKEAYEEVCLRYALWEQIQKKFRNWYSAPDNITKEQMYEIAKIIGLELDEKTDGR